MYNPWNKGLTKESNKKLEECSKKIALTLRKIYNSRKCDSCRAKISQKNKTGCCKKCMYKSDIFKKNMSNSTKGKCGGIRKGSGVGKQGWYKGYYCRSSWELAFVIYNIDHGIKFKINKKYFPYKYKKKTYLYYPDFVIGNLYIEIKGYDNPKNKAKRKMFPYKLKLIKEKEIRPYLNYVKSKYGNNFIKLYKQGDIV